MIAQVLAVAIQIQLQRNNPTLFNQAAETLPDGDADLADQHIHNVNVPICERCAGTLMPNVVFFGGTVPKARVKQCMDSVERADALLSIGSSLQVFSGYRFCRKAHELGKPVVLINPGITRRIKLQMRAKGLKISVRNRPMYRLRICKIYLS